MAQYQVGLDLGGTKLLGLVVGEERVLCREKWTVPSFEGPADLVQWIAHCYRQLTHEFQAEDIHSIGLALPGPVDPESGIVHRLTAFGWDRVPVGALLKEHLGVDARLENDVNAATLAEFKLGAGQGVNSLFTFYPGTGLGGGYISGGQLIRGKNGTAGEVGHMVVQMDGPSCSCGQTGCLEAIVSNQGVRNLLKQDRFRSRDSVLLSASTLTGDILVQAWRKGDPVAQDVLTYQARTLGIGVANVINITGVERILIGGIVFTQLASDLFPLVEAAARQHSIGGGMEGVELKANALGEQAPALGMTLF